MTDLAIIGGLGALVVAALAGMILAARKGGRDAERAAQAEATAQAVQRGAEGAAEATTALRKGKTPQQIREGNDKAWAKK